MDEESSDSELNFPEYGMHYVSVGHSDQILATVEMTTSLSPAKVKLRTYTGELILSWV